jgi:hypothetical protein
VTWSCDAIPGLNAVVQQQATAGVSAGILRTVMVPPSLLPSILPRITITAALNLNGVAGSTMATVPLNSAPLCSINSTSTLECFSLDVRNDTLPYANIQALALGWADSQDTLDQLRYEFRVRENGTTQDQVRSRGSSSSTAIKGLSAGAWVVYVCAIDSAAARTCVSRDVVIKPPAPGFDGAAMLNLLDVRSAAAVRCLLYLCARLPFLAGPCAQLHCIRIVECVHT